MCSVVLSHNCGGCAVLSSVHSFWLFASVGRETVEVNNKECHQYCLQYVIGYIYMRKGITLCKK